MLNPASDVYVPPTWPVRVTLAVPVGQYGEPTYDIEATGSALIWISVVVKLEQVPSVKVYVTVW